MLYVLAVCLTIGITGSFAYAYLIDRKETVNLVRAADLEDKTHIEEEFEPPEQVKPGQVIKKKPCIRNEAEIPVYVRVKIAFTSQEAMEQCEPLQIHANWKKREDGYYYYQKKVLEGTCTETIFDNIVIKDTISEEEIVPFELLIYEEAIQAEGFSSAEDAFREM